MNEIKSIFLLEENITRAYAIAQNQVYQMIVNSKLTIKDLAKDLNMNRDTLSKKLKGQTFEAKEFYDLLALINKKLLSNLQENNKEKENGK